MPVWRKAPKKKTPFKVMNGPILCVASKSGPIRRLPAESAGNGTRLPYWWAEPRSFFPRNDDFRGALRDSHISIHSTSRSASHRPVIKCTSAGKICQDWFGSVLFGARLLNAALT